MSTIDKTGGATAEKMPYQRLKKIFVLGNTVDLTGDSITEGDVYQCLAVPANTHVLQVNIIMVTPAVGTTLTATAGDGRDTDGWSCSQDHKGEAGTAYASAVGTDAYAASGVLGTFYAFADSIDVTYSTATAITAGPKFRITALCVDFAREVRHTTQNGAGEHWWVDYHQGHLRRLRQVPCRPFGWRYYREPARQRRRL